jgi:hypothetical protein
VRDRITQRYSLFASFHVFTRSELRITLYLLSSPKSSSRTIIIDVLDFQNREVNFQKVVSCSVCVRSLFISCNNACSLE